MDSAIPEGAIPAEQFQPASAQMPSQAVPEGAVPADQFQASDIPEGAIPVEQFKSQDDVYGTPGQQAIAGVEGVAKGVLGPLAPLAERGLGVSAEGIRGREAANPWTHGAGQAAGLIGGAFTGTGEAAVMAKAGQYATEALGLAKPATLLAKVGSSAVQQAAEMAVLQSGDEASKAILQDPQFSAESAISNVGLAAAIGAGTGAFVTGAVSPLWNATLGPKLQKLLTVAKDSANGVARVAMTPEVEAAATKLGIPVDAVQRALLAEEQGVRDIAGTLRRSENPEVLEAVEKIHNDASNAAFDSLGITKDSVLDYDKNTAGHALKEALDTAISEKYAPAEAAMEARNSEAAPIRLSDNARLEQAAKLTEDAIKDPGIGTQSEHFPLIEKWNDRLLAADTVGHVDALKTQLGNDIKKAARAGDDNLRHVLTTIKQSFAEFQESAMEAAAVAKDKAVMAEKIAGMPKVTSGAQSSEVPAVEDLIARRKAQNQVYAKYANVMDTLLDHVGAGDFKGTEKLRSKLISDLSPEELYKKLSIKGNADFIPFLQEHFPTVYEKVIENERREMVRPAVLAAAKRGENPIDIKRMSDIVNSAKAGGSKYVNAVLPDEAVQKINAANTVVRNIVSPRDSGTPAGLSKLYKHMLPSALAAVSWATGHGPLGGYMAGQAAELAGKNAPEAIKLAYLKFLSSESAVNAPAFKNVINMVHNSLQAQKALGEATSAVLKGGAQIAVSNLISAKSREKLDKLVDAAPEEIDKTQEVGQVGHYMPAHQSAMAQNTSAQIQYLKSLKPQPFQGGPLDKPIEPSPAQMARYNRALDISNAPLSVLQDVKDGTIKASDIHDLTALYPTLKTQMDKQLAQKVMETHGNEEPIPYHTRMGLSIFLNSPMDSSMTPQSIRAAQPPPRAPQQSPQEPMKGKAGKTAVNKLPNAYKTPNQSAESDRSNRE